MTARGYGPPATRARLAAPAAARTGGASIAHQAARAQALLDRIAAVGEHGMSGELRGDSVDHLLQALDEREALLTELTPVVAELALVRTQLARAEDEASAAEARALELAIAPVERAARKALDFHHVLLEKMQAVRDEMAWELDRLDQLGAMAGGYLGQPGRAVARVDVRG